MITAIFSDLKLSLFRLYRQLIGKIDGKTIMIDYFFVLGNMKKQHFRRLSENAA